jgi:hypothetical protein
MCTDTDLLCSPQAEINRDRNARAATLLNTGATLRESVARPRRRCRRAALASEDHATVESHLIRLRRVADVWRERKQAWIHRDLAAFEFHLGKRDYKMAALILGSLRVWMARRFGEGGFFYDRSIAILEAASARRA